MRLFFLFYIDMSDAHMRLRLPIDRTFAQIFLGNRLVVML
jgi:hypothetical protein